MAELSDFEATVAEGVPAEPPKVDMWAVVDVMGHQRYTGRVTEQVIAGCGFVRVDVPASEGVPGFTKLIGTSSIYAISPVEEAIARRIAASQRQTPIESYALQTPAAITERPGRPSIRREHFDEDDFDEDDY